MGATMSEAHDYRHRRIGDRELHPETLMMGYGYDPQLSEGAVKCPIFQTSTFVFRSAEDGKAFFELAYGMRERGPTEVPGLIYSRINNPDLEILEDRLAIWDGAEAALVFSSGMAAISTTLLTFLRPGDAIVHSEPVYGGTEYLLLNVLPQFGIKRFGFTAGEPGALEEAVEDARAAGRIGVVLIETPANPTNALVDIQACAALAATARKGQGNAPSWPWTTPSWAPLAAAPGPRRGPGPLLPHQVRGRSQRPHRRARPGRPGADRQVAGMRTILGTMADPWTGWLLMRSLETLKLRMTSQMKNARYIAEFLRTTRRCAGSTTSGSWPTTTRSGRSSSGSACRRAAPSPSRWTAGRRRRSGSSMRLRIAKLAVSLGGTETLMQHPATMTHADVKPEHQKAIGITPGMIRISVGVEHPEDIIADLGQALEQL
jgi:methionine-gamma-lyase